MATHLDPTARGRGRSGRPWERVKALVFEQERCGWVCGAEVDQ